MALSNNLTVSIGADSSKLRADLALAQQRLKQFGAELRAAAATAAQTGDTRPVERLAASYEDARRQVAGLTGQLRVANREIVATGTAAQAAGRHFSTMNDHVGRVGGSLSAMGTSTRRWALAFSAAVTGAAVALGKLTTSAARSLDDLDDLAKATGTTTQEIEKLKLVAAAAGDKDFDAMGKALERTTRSMGEAQIEAEKLNNVISFTGGKRDFSDVYKALDIDVTRFKDPIALIEEFARRLDRESNAAIKASLANQMWGKSWARVLPNMINLRANMEAAEKAIVAGGGFTSQRSIEAANQYLAVLGKLEFQFGRIRDAAGAQLGAALAPAIQQLTQYVGQNMSAISAWIVNAATYIRALTQDLTRFFLLGRGAEGQDTEWGKWIIDAFLYLKNDLIPGLTSAFRSVMGVLDQIAASINSIFGTNLTGGQVGLALVIGQVTGAFNTLAIAIGAAATVFAALLPIMGPAGWLILGMAAISAAIVTMTGQWGELGKAIVSAGQQIAGGMQIAWDWLKKTASQIANMPAPAGGAVKFAAGGQVPGRGTGDIVPAWLTPGEFVIRRSVVDTLGADFFAQLNRGMGSLLPRSHFATGGFVAEAAGGGTPVHLHLGGQSFALHGNSNVVDALVVEAKRAHIRSAGVKPSWYGGR